MGRQVPEVVLLLCALAACRPAEAPPAPAPRAVDLSAATRKALAELALPLAIRVDLRGLPREEQARAQELLEALAATGRARWSRAAFDKPGLELAAGPRTETLALPSATRLETAEVEAAVTTRLLRLARGRKRVAVTDDDARAGLTDPELGLSRDYEVVGTDWDADVVIVDGPRQPFPTEALERRLAADRPTLILLRPDGDPGLAALVARHGFTVRPELLVDPKNGTPVVVGAFTTTLYAPLAQVVAGGPGDPLAHLSYVACPFVAPIDAAPGARALLRAAPSAYAIPAGTPLGPSPPPGSPAGSPVVAWARGRLVVVGSAALVGADRLALHRQLGAEVTSGGFRAVHEIVDWLAADVDLMIP